MRKGTIFYYEFKRLLFSRAYLLLLAATLFYCVTLLRSIVLFGVAYTAPFSQWTFCGFLSSISTLLLVLLLALCARQFTSSELGAAAIISATPLPESAFRAIRYSAIACAYMIAAVLSVMICFLFYWLVFDYTALGELLLSALLLLLPSALLVFGAAMLLGKKKGALVYVLLGAVLVVGVFNISLPAFADLPGSSVSMTLQAGNQEFSFTTAFLLGRIAFVAAGTTFIILSLRLGKETMGTVLAVDSPQ